MRIEQRWFVGVTIPTMKKQQTWGLNAYDSGMMVSDEGIELVIFQAVDFAWFLLMHN